MSALSAAVFLLSCLPAAGGLPPLESLRRIEVVPGFRVELVAAEPLVRDPVALAWDTRMRLWVVEMSDYPEGTPEGGRVCILEDADGDGRPDRVSVFAAGLHFPTSVLPFGRGAFIASAPDILYFKDGDGDGKADERTAVLTGFNPGNPQLRANGLLFGPDGWIYGANGRSGGRIRRPGDPLAAAIDITAADFRFDPETFVVEAVSGPSQFGHAFDGWGRRFLSWNTIHAREVVLEPADLERHPHLAQVRTIAEISDHGGSARLYPSRSPPETFNAEPVDRFNAAAGVAVECGGVFPPPYAGSLFTCEPLLGVVHRDELAGTNRPHAEARRGQAGSEFLTSSDPWFHPVFVASGPDGALYVADFYRRWIEHPDFVPPALRNRIDWTEGRGHGRIYRVVPEKTGFRPLEDFESLGPGAAARKLCDAAGVRRELAARRMLYHARDPERRRVSAGELAKIARSPQCPPPARAYAIRLLERLGFLEDADLDAALAAQVPELRETGLRALRERPPSPRFAARIQSLARDPHPRVRLQAVLALGDPGRVKEEAAVALLVSSVMEHGGDPWLRRAILSGLHGREKAFVTELARRLGETRRAGLEEEPRARLELLREAAALAVRSGAPPSELLRDAAASTVPGQGAQTLFALSLGILEGGAARATLPEAVVRKAREAVADATKPPALRRDGVRLLGALGSEEDVTILAGLLAAGGNEPELRTEAAAALGRTGNAQAYKVLADSLSGAGEPVRTAIFNALLGRKEGYEAVLSALESGSLAAEDLSPVERYALSATVPPALREAFAKRLASHRPGRAAIVDAYLRRMPSRGDAERGRALFLEHCARCHRLGGLGHDVGPGLGGAARKDRASLASDILDPNRSIAPGYEAWVALTRDGRVVTGVVRARTRTAIEIRSPGGFETVLAVERLARTEKLARSLMPEGLEEVLSPEGLAHILEFLTSHGEGGTEAHSERPRSPGQAR